MTRMGASTQMSDDVYRDAETVYDYHRMGMPVRPASAIFCLCSLDVRVAAHAADLYIQGVAPLVIFSGNTGALTAGLFTKPEAEVFADVARSMGVPDDRILVEPEARNTGENVRFTHALLKARNIPIKSFVLVQKPYMERRTFATFVKQWPQEGSEGMVEFTVTSPPMSFGDYPDDTNPRDLVTSIIVGDLVRIRDYPAKGFQIEQDIPEEVWEAGQRLIKAGYDRHLP